MQSATFHLFTTFSIAFGLTLGGCADDRQRNPLELSVEKLVTISSGPHEGDTCYVACRGSTEPSEVLDQTCSSLELDAAWIDEHSDCGFAAGDSRIRVSVRYNVRVPAHTTLASPVLTLVTDRGAAAQTTVFDLRAEERFGDEFPVAVASLPTPSTSTTSLDFRVTVADDVVVASSSKHSQRYWIDAVQPKLRIQECQDRMPCELASGIGSATVELVAPLGFSGASVTLSTSLGGVAQLGASVQSVSIVSNGDMARAVQALPVPSGIGRLWKIEALVNGQYGSAEAMLRTPRPPVMTVKSGDGTELDLSKLLPRTASEPEEGCRTYLVDLEVVDAPSVGALSLQTSAGSFAGGSNKLVPTLDGADKGRATLVLPPTMESVTTLLELQVDTFRSAQARLRLKDVLPLQGSGRLIAASREIPVDANGTLGGVVLHGSVATLPGAAFNAGARVSIRTRAKAASAHSLPCGRPIAASALDCDPFVPADSGGCFLLPSVAALDASGSYTLSLSSGLCFAGEVEISAWSRAYPSNAPRDKCLGELPQSDPVALSSIVLTFAAP